MIPACYRTSQLYGRAFGTGYQTAVRRATSFKLISTSWSSSLPLSEAQHGGAYLWPSNRHHAAPTHPSASIHRVSCPVGLIRDWEEEFRAAAVKVRPVLEASASFRRSLSTLAGRGSRSGSTSSPRFSDYSSVYFSHLARSLNLSLDLRRSQKYPSVYLVKTSGPAEGSF